MKIGLHFYPVDPEFLFPVARRADELGYESLWLGEHMAFPTTMVSKHPYYPGRVPPPATPLYDPLITLGYIAAQTTRLKLGTGIYLIALRHPIVAARLLATLDNLSGGRLLVGAGVGWLKEEFDAVDVPWAHRGARMEENIAVMRRLWSEERVAHDGRFYRFEEIGFSPKPVGGKVPILIGGETPVAIRRAARLGDGWTGVSATPESAAARVKELRALRETDEPFEIAVTCAGVPDVDELRRFRDAGVDRLTLMGPVLAGDSRTVEDLIDRLSRFAEEAMHRF